MKGVLFTLVALYAWAIEALFEEDVEDISPAVEEMQPNLRGSSKAEESFAERLLANDEQFDAIQHVHPFEADLFHFDEMKSQGEEETFAERMLANDKQYDAIQHAHQLPKGHLGHSPYYSYAS